jgi:hypothetical protein
MQRQEQESQRQEQESQEQHQRLWMDFRDNRRDPGMDSDELDVTDMTTEESFSIARLVSADLSDNGTDNAAQLGKHDASFGRLVVTT